MTRVAVAAALLLAACGDDLGQAPSCGEIAEGGCPVARGGSCDDPACRALYACVDGAWTLSSICGPVDASASEAGDAGDASEAGANACDASTDLPGSTATGCSPSLELPDCPIEVALACSATACTTGCEQFFACTVDGWSTSPVAACDAGELVVP